MLRSLRSRRSLGNPLVRRVQRHASITTLFRTPEERFLVENHSPFLPSGMGGIFPRVSATLSPDALPLPGDTLLQGGFPQVAPSSGRIQSLAAGAPQPAPVQLSPLPTPAVQPARPTASPPTPSTPVMPSRASSQPVSQPASSEPPKNEEDDTIWRRLQTIFHRHQEKNVTEQAGAASPEPAAAETMPPVTASSTRRSSAADVSPEMPAASGAQPLSGQQKAVETSVSKAPLPPQLPLTSGPRLPRTVIQEFPAEAKPPLPFETPGSSTREPQFPPAVPSIPVRSASPLRPPPSLDEVETSDHPIETAREDAQPSAVQPLADVPGQVRSEAAALPQPEAASIPSASSPDQSPSPSPLPPQDAPTLVAPPVRASQPDDARSLQTRPEVEPEAGFEGQPQVTASLPLEEIWPVERLDQPARSASGPAQLSELELPPPDPALASTPEAQHVQRLLQEVSPGQPTDSHVELITPRRPRPPAVSGSPAVQPAPLEAQTPGVLAPQAAAPEPQAVFPTLIPTSIGPLPADLWGLIGESPPGGQPSELPAQPPAALPVQRRPADAPSTALPPINQVPVSYVPVQEPPVHEPQVREPQVREPQVHNLPPAPDASAPPSPLRAPDAPAALSPVETPARSAHHFKTLDLVQLAPEANSSLADGGSAFKIDRDPQDEETGSQEGAQVDVEELSRRVYAEIKRRLAAEWERMRRKF